MVEFKYNEMMERWDAELPYELGDLKEMTCVASIDPEDNTITFWKPLSITDVRKILNKCDELKHELDKNPLDEIDIKEKKVHFEPYPDE